MAHWFLSWRVYIWSAVTHHRPTMSDLKRIKKLQQISYLSFTLLWSRKSAFPLIMSCICTMPFATHVYDLFEVVMYRFSQIVCLCTWIISTVGIWIFSKFAPMMECFSIQFVSNITWDSITFEIIIQVIRFVKDLAHVYCVRLLLRSRNLDTKFPAITKI